MNILYIFARWTLLRDLDTVWLTHNLCNLCVSLKTGSLLSECWCLCSRFVVVVFWRILFRSLLLIIDACIISVLALTRISRIWFVLAFFQVNSASCSFHLNGNRFILEFRLVLQQCSCNTTYGLHVDYSVTRYSDTSARYCAHSVTLFYCIVL